MTSIVNKPVYDVTVVLLGNGLSSTSILPAEIFHCAGMLWNALRNEPGEPRFRVRTISLDDAPVHSPYRLGMMPDTPMAGIEHTDIIVVPTSGLDLDPALVRNSGLLPWLRHHYDRGAYIAGVCMGAAYLAEAGLLDGRVATTHWALAADFAARYPAVRWQAELFVTEDSRLLCSGGVCGSIDVSLYLVEKLCGHEIALQCAKALLLPMPRIYQSGYAMLPVSRAHDDRRIRAIELFLHANLRANMPIRDLAAKAGMAERTFVRHFKAATGKMPAAYLQAIRIDAAKVMLERDTRPIQTISSDVGYDDVAFFRSLFKRATGMTPAGYRALFAPLAVRGHVMPEGPDPSDIFAAA